MRTLTHEWAEGEIFVFGSNLSGRHGAGAARDALQQYGAIYGRGVGPQGRSYAIPTKDANIRTLPLYLIRNYVNRFCVYAAEHPDETFFLTRIGCGLAGYTDEEIAPLFADCPPNVRKPPTW